MAYSENTNQPDALSYEAMMRSREMWRAEAKMLARDLEDAKEALKPFAELAPICEHFKKTPGEQICSWRIGGKRYWGPTVADCIEARRVLGPPLESVRSGTRAGE